MKIIFYFTVLYGGITHWLSIEVLTDTASEGMRNQSPGLEHNSLAILALPQIFLYSLEQVPSALLISAIQFLKYKTMYLLFLGVFKLRSLLL